MANVPTNKKTEVIQLIYQLQVKELCGKKKRVEEISACFKVIYPQIINQLPSKDLDLRDAAIQFLHNRYMFLIDKLISLIERVYQHENAT